VIEPSAKDEGKRIAVTSHMGREYSVECPPDEHEALVVSAEFLNDRMMAIRKRGKALGTERIAVMVALKSRRELLQMKAMAASAASIRRRRSASGSCGLTSTARSPPSELRAWPAGKSSTSAREKIPACNPDICYHQTGVSCGTRRSL